ncbi:MAG: hypothetical protein EOO02_14625 [Chitinophagaceae bacterium]|nr:MAG: hypothetical protein EOO02_14625 [Chitinophagaceae bacterium]
MMNATQLKFLKNKVADIESALFSNESEAVLKLPTRIVKALNMDDSGQIWFLLPPPPQQIQEFDKEFPSKLRFFQKGKSYFLHISGKAYIINDPEEITHLVDLSDEIRTDAVNNRCVIVKMRVQKAEYFERESEKSLVGFTSLVNKMFSWLFDLKPALRPSYKVNDTAAA